jgi:O-acetyl-ADP-ribose deacetylase
VTSPWNRIDVIEADITRLDVDAVVNAANSTLLGGGGVDGAIHRAAGPELLAECRKLGGCKTGEAKITQGYNLKARWVIHTVGPVFRGGNQGEPQWLASCYESSLRLARENAIRSIAFPAISCGVFSYPMEQAARIAIRTTATYVDSHHDIEKVVFALMGAGFGSAESAYDTYCRIIDELSQA